MTQDETVRREAEQKKNMQRDNVARKGLGSSRPNAELLTDTLSLATSAE